MFLPPALARIPLPANRRYAAVRTRLRHAVSDMIDRNRTEGGAIGGDLLTALLESAPATPDSRTELVDELILMLMAGTESTATTVAWTLHELSRDPDRWLADNQHPAVRKALIPFGGGTRKCAGDTFALTESALVLASIMSRWTVEPVRRNTVRLAAYGALQPQGLYLRTVAR
ncbi:cytochrome P450 [Nocardia sp. NPDC059764]|uniref:cytochrome P450 n=1 Tax=Nocardia sp. NPDC059764 TaxID=3346939 RepID=UPI0036491599